MATSTFSRKSYCEHVQDFVLSNRQLERRCPLDFGHRKPLSIETSPSPLERLPPEIAWDIFSTLDIQSLFSLRRASKTLMAWVNSLPEYHQIIQHAPNTIRAILSLETASYIALHQLYRSLRSRACHTCSLPAPYLCVLTGERLCPRCPLSQEKRYPMLMEEACGKFRLSPEDLNDVKRFRARPGSYGGVNLGPPERTVALTHLKSSVWLFEPQECAEQAAKLQQAAEIHRMRLLRRTHIGNTKSWARWSSKKRLPPLPLRNDPPPYDRLFMNIVVAPWITAGGIAWDVHCRHCQINLHRIRVPGSHKESMRLLY
jgi:hypothetical protein